MSLEPLWRAPLEIQVHVALISLAALLTPVQLLLKKGTRLHRCLGLVWIVAMISGALSSFFVHSIRSIGPFSPIHLLSILTLISVPLAWWSARTGRIMLHRRIMESLVLYALLGAGIFTLLPGRLMNAVVFGP